MKPVALRAGPADEKLVHVVKSFLHDADTIYGTNRPGNNIETWDIDELGQLILPNDLSGGRSGSEGYYGWSESFCEKMKLRDIEKPIAGSLLQHHQVDLGSRRKRRTRSYSPPDVEAPGDCRAGSGKESITATGNGGSLQTSSPTPAFLHQGFFGPGQIPVPPPRPPNYHGPWPPPPPVPPGYNVSSIPASALHGQQSGHYPTQGHQGGIGNLTSLASQPWNHQNDTAASQGRGSRAH
ncbi:MAG: hypothetical protein Q9188_004079 [Gyalolechia gomerana]